MGAMRLRLVVRLIRLIQRVQKPEPLPPVPALAREFQCSQRTMWRDLRALEDAGLTIRKADRWEDAA